LIGLLCFVLAVLASPFKSKLRLEAENTGHWTKMHQSLVKFSESEASNHTPSLADFTTTTPELKFSVHTGADGRRDGDTLPFRYTFQVFHVGEGEIGGSL
jgi:hypothetical protein